MVESHLFGENNDDMQLFGDVSYDQQSDDEESEKNAQSYYEIGFEDGQMKRGKELVKF